MIRQYLEMPYLSRTECPLQFCSQNKNTFQDLYKLQIKYLSIPATFVPSERVFSKTGYN